MAKPSFLDTLLGRPLASSEEEQERLGTLTGIPTFGLDALSSAAYGPEAALTILLPLGLLGASYIVPITLAICVLLTIVYLSYRQTIAAYPSGGGSYTVAGENLGVNASLLAASALMIDYLLNVAVGISAGVGAIISAVPALQPHTLALCLVILAILTIVNLRGMGEAGTLFMLPTVLFVATLIIAIAIGLGATFSAHGHPHPVIAPPVTKAVVHTLSIWLVLRAFASGCTAMTGVEAVSNGVQAFREPVVKSAQRTLGAIIATLIILLAGIAFLSHAYGITATEPGSPSYQSVLSQLLAAVAGKGVFYYVSITSIVLVLCLSANTSFADFPRLCRAVAENSYLPRSFANRGRRLVYSEGICVLAAMAAVLLIVFDGVTDNLIPLFAVGAFLAFTLSQSGMVAHWRRSGGAGAHSSMIINGLGAIATAITTGIVVVAKFKQGAWIVVLLIPTLIAIMWAVHRHYEKLEQETETEFEFNPGHPEHPLVVIPIDHWNRLSRRALRFAVTLSDDIEAVHIESETRSNSLEKDWQRFVEQPAREVGRAVPRLVILKSPYRFIIQPFVDRVLKLQEEHPNRMIAVLLPHLIESHWYNFLLHNERSELIAARLLLKGEDRVMFVNVPWRLPD